ncbi:hypothetical protein AOCH_001865 [Aspergillus ochraceoroseus]|nr:hypothetical protein AOCH_001865 [Aspergillus ochraceoroseus]
MAAPQQALQHTMSRKDFQRDVVQACVPGLFPRLADVRGGSEDGLIAFTYRVPSNSNSIKIQVSVPDTSEYPESHQYFAYIENDKVPEAVPMILEASQSSWNGLSVRDFLKAISECLDEATLGGDCQWDRLQDDSDQDFEDAYDEMDWEMEDEKDFSPRFDDRELRENIRSDLRKARNAGLRVGYLGELNGAVILCASSRIAKLGISVEAMQAWNVRPTDFFVLLLRYPQNYRPLADIVSSRGAEGGFIQMYVGVCESYKPSLNCARHIFASKEAQKPADVNEVTNLEPALNPIFIGKSLNSLLNERFLHIVKCRLDYGFSWTGAELYVSDGQGKITDIRERENPKYFQVEDWSASSPAFLVADHLANVQNRSDMSLLLVAMQFTLRRFVKCTEFCLNCYCKINAGFEAIKPFICSNGLCLYQYLALGMGPSLEWEISSQPYVVDLLISFAYTSIVSGKLNNLPNGLQLKIPPPTSNSITWKAYEGQMFTTEPSGLCLRVGNSINLKHGDWIVVMLPVAQGTQGEPPELHAYVKDVSKWPDICLSYPIFRNITTDQKEWEGSLHGELCDRDENFRRRVVRGEAASLAQWQHRISPSALLLLQWIVGSNRSVIIYDDDPEHQVSGMESYLQFRFAQGAPDKEERFVASVTRTALRLQLQYPTLFAWHGSPMCNWHGILREGLHYKQIVNGRQFGDGVYMSQDFSVSTGYCNRNFSPVYQNWQWPQSILKCSTAISLNEVVNAPAEYVSSRPHYVVGDVDWIQPRYLFVKCQTIPQSLDKSKPRQPSNIYDQDPSCLVRGPQQQQIKIPLSAVNSHRIHTSPREVKKKTKKKAARLQELKSILKIPQGQEILATGNSTNDDDADSIATLMEDQLLLLSDSEEGFGHEQPKSTGLVQSTVLKTDFKPGSLDPSSVQLLGDPTYATPTATKVLQKQLRVALRTQKKEPMHELGWYINENLISNVYQWIVELHSFDPNHPLARDFNSAGLTSIVLEIRYPSQFPISPPFVRIIRPRFLRFSSGGGGHITAGGAMCMELLTNSGWLPTSSIESVLLQVRMAILNPVPQPARLDPKNWGKDYTVSEAIAEYKRVCICHGWNVPDDINQLAWT